MVLISESQQSIIHLSAHASQPYFIALCFSDFINQPSILSLKVVFQDNASHTVIQAVKYCPWTRITDCFPKKKKKTTLSDSLSHSLSLFVFICSVLFLKTISFSHTETCKCFDNGNKSSD